MKHQKQKYFECMLATISMLSDIDYDIVRTFANRIVKRKFNLPYGQFMASRSYEFSPMKKNEIVARITRKFHVTKYIDTHNSSINQSQLQLLQGTKFDFSGKGSVGLALFHSDGTLGARHIVAYENNMIYDSEENGPMPVEEYFSKYPKTKIERITDGRTNKEKILDKITK